MKRQLTVLFCTIACMFILISCKKGNSPSLQNTEISAKAESNKATPTRPFKGVYTTTVEVLSGPPLLQQRITGTGNATHLGESTFIALNTVNFTTPPPFQVSGTTTFWADNGDTFFTSYTGTSTPIGGGISSVVINHTITGGTGRFSDAGGSFTGNTLANPALPTGTITYQGTISY